jgi:uncharacterized protein YciI
MYGTAHGWCRREGVSVYETSSLEEAKMLAESDPAVKSGHFIIELHPWLGPKGIGAGYAERATEKPLQELEFDTFQLGLLWRGDKWSPEETEASNKLQEDHLANIRRLAKEGKLIAAGPFTDGGELRGVFLFTTPTLEEAKSLAETDPAVQAGRLKMELHTWMVNKGVVPPVSE